MSILLVDIGNSRIKWALARADRMGPMRAAGHGQFVQFGRWLAGARGIESVAAVNVAGEAAARRLQSVLRRHGFPAARFARSTATAAGVTNGYAEPWRLGADRWVAAIGAWHEAGCRRCVCSISVGTALTIDVVDARGRHRGGLIAPAPDLMMRALLGNTHGIAVRASRASRAPPRRPTPALLPFAATTREAVQQGGLVAAAALVDRCAAEVAAGLGTKPRVFLTGGAAEQVMPRLACRFEYLPDLVLRGLRVLHAQPGPAA